MEITFKNSCVDAWEECFRQTRRTQTDMDCVVPDTQEDIGRLLSVQPTLLLREKTISGRSAFVRGEVQISLLYINELESDVSAIRLEKSWQLEYELPFEAADAVPQVTLDPVRAEARILNPRKVSVTVEIAGELSVFTPGQMITGTQPPEDPGVCIHRKHSIQRVALIRAVGEKSFIISDQSPFSPVHSTGETLLCQSAAFRVGSWQSVGNRVLVKGFLRLRVCLAPQGGGAPFAEEFDLPFSQLLDVGEETPDGCSFRLVMTSVWFSLADGINGEKLLNTEVHALLQFVSRRWEELSLLTDAYCNCMPSELDCSEHRYAASAAPVELRLTAEERLLLSDDCAESVLVLPQAGECGFSEGRAALPTGLDILYRTNAGNLSCIHRRIEPSAAVADAQYHLLSAALGELKMRREGENLVVQLDAALMCEDTAALSVVAVDAIRLDEERPFDLRALPSLIAVRAGEQTSWELARLWHSSAEKIEAWNGWKGENDGRLLLIPRCE